MPFEHRRIQHPVGQGFFHTALVSTPTSSFRYVYDCGSNSGRLVLNRAIDAYRNAWDAAETLDLLCLSHAHNDHFNGLVRLLAGRSVDTVMLPLLSQGERLVAFAQSRAADPAPEDLPFLTEFTLDPERALERYFAPRQILLVRREGSGGRAPGGGEAPVVPPPSEGGPLVTGPFGASWQLVGAGQAALSPRSRRMARAGLRVPKGVRLADSHALSIDEQEGWGSWLLAPFVDANVPYRQEEFLNAFRDKLRDPLGELRLNALLRRTVASEDMTAALVETYNEFRLDLNASSLCLYSGPARPRAQASATLTLAADRAFDAYWAGRERRVAWLGTGDAVLRGERKLTSLSNHFAPHLGRVGTMTLPHHGSDRNMDPALIRHVDASRHVVSARRDNEHHPGQGVTALFGPYGLGTMTLVTDDPLSICVEDVR